MKSVLILILIFVIVLSLFIFPKQKVTTHENFEGEIISGNPILDKMKYDNTVLASIISNQGMNANITDNLQVNNRPCSIPVENGKNHMFTAAGTTLDWFDIPERSHSCALEMSSIDMNNNPINCSQTNAKMYDPNVVKDIYLKGTFSDLQRCEVDFKDNVTKEQMDAYTSNLRSYIVYTDCDRFKKDVIRLEAENKSTNEKIAQSKKNIVIANQLAANKKAEAADLASKATALNKQSEEDKSKAKAEKAAADLAKKEAENTRLEKEKLQKEKNRVTSENDKKLYDLRIASLNELQKTAEDTAKVRAQNAIQLENLATKNQQIADVNKQMSDNAAAQVIEMQNIANAEKIKIDAAQLRQTAAQKASDLTRTQIKEADIKNDFRPYNSEIYVPKHPNMVLTTSPLPKNESGESSQIPENLPVMVHERWNGDVQKWTMDDQDRIRNTQSGNCLTFINPKTLVKLQKCTEKENQKWYYDDQQRLHAKANPSQCLDISHIRYVNNQPVHAWPCHDGQNQKWKVQSKQDEDNRLNIAKVTLYQHPGYTGSKHEFTIGSYRFKDLQARGVVNDSISSIKVPVGVRARLFEHDDFTGREISTTQDIYSFVDKNINFDNKLSSMIIEKDANTIRDSYDVTNERNNNFLPQVLKNDAYKSLGCWADTANRAIPTVEKTDPLLQDPYHKRFDAINKCYDVARKKGHTVFAVQNGGWCATSPDAANTYKKYGPTNRCLSNGKGGHWANQVYEIKHG